MLDRTSESVVEFDRRRDLNTNNFICSDTYNNERIFLTNPAKKVIKTMYTYYYLHPISVARTEENRYLSDGREVTVLNEGSEQNEDLHTRKGFS